MREKLSFDWREADHAPFLFDAVIDHDGDHRGQQIQQDCTGGLHDAAIQLAAFCAGTVEDLDTHHVQRRPAFMQLILDEEEWSSGE